MTHQWVFLIATIQFHNNNAFVRNETVKCGLFDFAGKSDSYKTFRTLKYLPENKNTLFELEFSVQSSVGVSLVLASKKFTDINTVKFPYFKFDFGGERHDYVELLDGLEGNRVLGVASGTAGIISPNEFQAFHVRALKDGTIKFGEKDKTPLISYNTNNKNLPLKYFSFATTVSTEDTMIVFDCSRLSNSSILPNEDLKPNEDSTSSTDHVPNDKIVRTNEHSTSIKDLTPNEDSTSSKDLTPNEDIPPSKDLAPNENSTPNEDSTPNKDLIPYKDSTTSKDLTPNKNSTPSKDPIRTEDSTPNKDLTPYEDSTSNEDLTTYEDSTPNKDLTPYEDSTSNKELTSNENSTPSKDLTPNEDSTFNKDLTPTEDIIAYKDLTPNKDTSPNKDLTPHEDSTPNKDLTPNEDTTPNKDITPHEDTTPNEVLTPYEDSTPKKDLTPSEDNTPNKDLTPYEDTTPITARFECDKGEEYKKCGRQCELTCKDIGKKRTCSDKCVAGCTCKRGYRRDDSGRCIRQSQCPAYIRCYASKGEKYKQCGRQCEPTCKDIGKRPTCSDKCIRGCTCRSGYRRDDSGNCIKETMCPPIIQCDPCKGEVYRICGRQCEPTCKDIGKNSTCSDKCIKGCTCMSGYRRDDSGRCIKENMCPPPIKCDSCKGEVYKKCGRQCELTCKDNIGKGPICWDLCIEGCTCKDGYRRNDSGSCIEEHMCPTNTRCDDSKGEEYNKCGRQCEPTCNDIGKKPTCSDKCVEGCTCKSGYRRDDSGSCIRYYKCPTVIQCDDSKGEEYNKCGKQCEPTCNDIGKEQKCSALCSRGCTCKSGYRRDNVGRCIEERECPAFRRLGSSKRRNYQKCRRQCELSCGEKTGRKKQKCLDKCFEGCDV